MNKYTITIIVILILLLLGVSVGLYVSIQNSKQSQYEMLYKNSQKNIKIRDEKIEILKKKEEESIEKIKQYKDGKALAEANADKYLKQARALKQKLMSVVDTLTVHDTLIKEVMSNTLDKYELTVESQDLALLQCDSTIASMQKVNDILNKQFLLSQANNRSKDFQIDLKSKELKAEKNKVIAIGTVGGVVVVGGLAGVIALSVLR